MFKGEQLASKVQLQDGTAPLAAPQPILSSTNPPSRNAVRFLTAAFPQQSCPSVYSTEVTGLFAHKLAPMHFHVQVA